MLQIGDGKYVLNKNMFSGMCINKGTNARLVGTLK
jgi:hypothetical protein